MSITTATERFIRQCRIVLMTVIMPTFARVAGTTPKRHFMPMFRRSMTQQNCQSKYENCYYDNVEQSWIPVVSGFLLSRVIRKDRDEPFVYNSGGSSFASRPVWRNTSGDYSWRSGSGKKSLTLQAALPPKKRQPFRAAAMVVLPAPVGIGEANHAETQRSCATGSGPDRR